jgi:hypothetical protein
MQEIYSLDFSRDGRFLVSGSGDKSARVWDIEKGTCVFDLRIEDFLHNEHGPIDAGITSVARKSFSYNSSSWSGRRHEREGRRKERGIGWGRKARGRDEEADEQYRLMENSLLLDLWIRWSEYGTSPPDNN